MKVYLDNCCFNRPYDRQDAERVKLETEAKLYIQGAIKDGKVALVWSFMLDYENCANPYPDQREAIAEWKTVSKCFVSTLDKIRERGNAIGKATGIKSKDALHLACAIEAECAYFITTDRSLLKKSLSLVELNTVNPIDFVMILEDSQ